VVGAQATAPAVPSFTKLRADGVDDSGSVFGQVWTIHVKVVAPQTGAPRAAPRQDMSFLGIVMELSGIWAICPA
jgi:hypothetical protein